MRIFVQEYLLALNSQNDGLRVVQDFVKKYWRKRKTWAIGLDLFPFRIHGPTMICPFPRVLSNFVSVCLAAIYNFFEDRKRYWLMIDFHAPRSFPSFTVSDLMTKTVVEHMKKKPNVKLFVTQPCWKPCEKIVLCFVKFCHELISSSRSTFDDWRPHLGLLLQSIPFPDEALTHDRFIEYGHIFHLSDDGTHLHRQSD